MGISTGVPLSPVLQQHQLLCIFSLLSLTLFSMFPSDPFVSSQLVQYIKARSGMEGAGAVLPLPAQDSRDSAPAAAAGPVGSAPARPRDPAPPDARTSGAEKPQRDKQDPAGCPLSQDQTPEAPEQECLIDSQPILFSENPFVVANRRGTALGGPPLGYGKGGVLKTNLYSKASSPGMRCVARGHAVAAARVLPSLIPPNTRFSSVVCGPLSPSTNVPRCCRACC